MNEYDWAGQFREVWVRSVAAYNAGKTKPQSLFSSQDVAFLASIGCTPQELFDFVEDFCRGGEPDYDSVLLVTSARRDYFYTIQHRQLSAKVISMDQLPPKSAALDGIEWLPRIIVKAQAKLRGEMPPELMYGCGGDRPFLTSVNTHLADFLRLVWAVDGDSQKVLDFVQEQIKRANA
ncbi:MAG: hypothetical protein JWM16_3238 [Verrucomicrobiales bacterium]|nr:hypothetical protein [Verrucomicrobiales bacterium]